MRIGGDEPTFVAPRIAGLYGVAARWLVIAFVLSRQ